MCYGLIRQNVTAPPTFPLSVPGGQEFIKWRVSFNLQRKPFHANLIKSLWFETNSNITSNSTLPIFIPHLLSRLSTLILKVICLNQALASRIMQASATTVIYRVMGMEG